MEIIILVMVLEKPRQMRNGGSECAIRPSIGAVNPTARNQCAAWMKRGRKDSALGKMRRLTRMRSYRIGGAEECRIPADPNAFILSRPVVEKISFVGMHNIVAVDLLAAIEVDCGSK